MPPLRLDYGCFTLGEVINDVPLFKIHCSYDVQLNLLLFFFQYSPLFTAFITTGSFTAISVSCGNSHRTRSSCYLYRNLGAGGAIASCRGFSLTISLIFAGRPRSLAVPLLNFSAFVLIVRLL